MSCYIKSRKNRTQTSETKQNQRPSHLQLHVVAEGTHDLHNLLRQLAGGREHERLALV